MPLIEFKYNDIKKYYEHYKMSDWRNIQRNKNLQTDKLVMQFSDTLILDNEPIVFNISIWEGMYVRRFHCNISIGSQVFKAQNKTLCECVKWVNKIFSQKTCSRCKKFGNISKSGLCTYCLEMDCLKVKTDKICPICLDSIERNVFRTRCSHYFHTHCIMNLQKCPVCRFNFYEEFNIPDSDNESESE